MVHMEEVRGLEPLGVLTTSTSVDMPAIQVIQLRSIALLQAVYARRAR